jgi:hypothetical protein
MTINGKVAEVIDQYKVVANKGKEDGVEEGMNFVIYEKKGGYTDPDTGEELGTREVIKAEVKVTEVYDKMSVLKSAEKKRIDPIAKQMSAITGTTKTKPLPTDSDVEKDELVVERGDPIRSVQEEDRDQDGS